MSTASHSIRANAVWHKSSYSNGSGGECVEVTTHDPAITGVRDSKDPNGPVLLFPSTAWAHFVAAVRQGELI
ncbi:DUF397 domain-containing protein [Streptomyces sp. 8N706]|uniref:DUF397 domain-containing protein n=1 Tax=Streptomyces sp. 8N706 TaxID=3457416 RepID=UPI003FD4B7AB